MTLALSTDRTPNSCHVIRVFSSFVTNSNCPTAGFNLNVASQEVAVFCDLESPESLTRLFTLNNED